jgi:hypothetical protein
VGTFTQRERERERERKRKRGELEISLLCRYIFYSNACLKDLRLSNEMLLYSEMVASLRFCVYISAPPYHILPSHEVCDKK